MPSCPTSWMTAPLRYSREQIKKYMDRVVWSPDELIMNFRSFPALDLQPGQGGFELVYPVSTDQVGF